MIASKYLVFSNYAGWKKPIFQFLVFIAKGHADLDIVYGIFGGDARRIGDMRHLFIDVLCDKFSDRITGPSLRTFAPQFE